MFRFIARWFVSIVLLEIVTFCQSASVSIGTVTVQGSLRMRGEAWDWFEGDGENAYAFSGNLARLGFSQQRKALDWQLEFAAPFLLGLPENAVAPGNQGQMGMGANYFAANDRQMNAAGVFVKQGYLRFKGLFKDDSQTLRVGRFEFLDGAGRRATTLCGRDAVQVRPTVQGAIDLGQLAARLAPIGDVRHNEHLVRFFADDVELTVFRDGRAIVKGTSDPAIARSLYARYVGS